MTVNAMFYLVPDLTRTVTMLHKIPDLGISAETISLLMAEQHVNFTDRDMIEQRVLEALVGSHMHMDMFTPFGPMLVIGPLQEKLRAAFIASPVNGLTACLHRLGAPMRAAICYGNGLRQGRILMTIHVKTVEERAGLERLLAELGVNL